MGPLGETRPAVKGAGAKWARCVGVVVVGLVAAVPTAGAGGDRAEARRAIIAGISGDDPTVCTTRFTDRGIIDDVNALYVRGFNGPQISDVAQARAECEKVQRDHATPAKSLIVVKKLVTTGRRARASVEVGLGGTYEFRLVRRAGHWKIDGVR